MLYIGVDLGTSAVKLLLMDGTGKILNIVSKEYPLYFPHPGWSEQNPEDWYTQVMAGIEELIKDADKSQVAGISFGGQMHGLVILDDKDQVIRPAILWNDGRTTEECDYLNNVIGKDKLSEYTANISFTGFTAPKILWVKNKEPENFARIKKIMLPKDYIAYKLSGVHCTDVSDASGMLIFDVKNRCWSKEMCEICGIHEDQLAKVYESYETVGTVLPEIAAKLGIPESCKVVAGAGDNAAAAVGTGTVGDGNCNISLGTSGTIFISSEKFGVDKFNALHAFAHADGHYHLMGCMLSAASCNKWWMDEIIGTKMRLISNDQYYTKTEYGTFVPGTDYNAMYNADDSLTLTITGIIRIDPDNDLALLGSGIIYSDKLSKLVIDRALDSEIVKAQKDSSTSVFTMEELDETSRQMTIASLGGDETPYMLMLYPKDFDTKDAITEYLDAWNAGKSDDDTIIYTDLAASISSMTNKSISRFELRGNRGMVQTKSRSDQFRHTGTRRL